MALDFGKLNFSVSFNPTSAFPLDARSYFESYASAQSAAATAKPAGSTDSVYYYGQTITVVENGVSSFYIIQPDGTLAPIAGNNEDAKLVINPSHFEYNADSQLSLKGLSQATQGNYFTVGENGSIVYSSGPDVYTKDEIDTKLKNLNHLSRKVVADLDEARDYLANNDDGDQYIYLVPSDTVIANDSYDEYVAVLVAGVLVLEKVGTWKTDLSNYATIEDLKKKVDKVEGSRLITSEEVTKLAGLKNSIIQSVNTNQFNIDESGKLFLTASVSDISGLQEVLDSKVTTKEGWTLLSPTDQEKLSNLSINDDGSVGISANVAAEKVTGLGDWITKNGATYISELTENNLSSSLVNKINYITTVDNNHFSVTNGELKFTPVDGQRLITSDEATLLNKLSNGVFNNFISSVDTNTFSVSQGKLALVDVPASALLTTVGDLTTLKDYDVSNPTTIVEEIKKLQEYLTWQSMSEE